MDCTYLVQDTVQCLDHVNLKNREFLDPLSRACDEEPVQGTCIRQLSGTYGGLVSCRLFVQNAQCADDYCQPTSPVQQPTRATAFHTNCSQIYMWEISVLLVVVVVVVTVI